MYINKAILIGNLTRDPELKSLPNGNKVCSLSLATNRTWKDANGQKQEAVDYHNIVCFGKTAEIVAQYMKKGRQVYVEGRLSTRNWDDKETGKKMYRTEIVADSVQFGTEAKAGSTGNSAPAAGGTAAPFAKDDTKSAKFEDESGPNIDYGDTVNPDDIPF
jgi:single-strand DNA-binding protein